MRLGGWKARVATSGIPTLYRIDEDPYVKKDLAESRPLERRFLTDALSTFLVYQKDWRKTRWGVASGTTIAERRPSSRRIRKCSASFAPASSSSAGISG